VRGGLIMMKKLRALYAIWIIWALLLSTMSYADHFQRGGFSSSGTFDVSIDKVELNNNVVVESRTNLINDADVFSVGVDLTAVDYMKAGHVEVSLRSTRTGDSVADSTGIFDLNAGTQGHITLTLTLIDKLKRETEFDLRVRVEDSEQRSETNHYRIKTESTRTTTSSGRGLDVSLDRVFVNTKVIASSRTNFIDEADVFNVLVEFTALEDLDDAHVEAVLKDLRTGTVVADASPNFDLLDEQSATALLRLELLDDLKDSDSFELTINLIDAEGDFVRQVYGIVMEDGVSGTGSSRALDISVDSVEIEKEVIIEDENNFVDLDKDTDELDLKVRLTALEDIEDARVDAILTLENGEVIADTTAIFDIRDDETVLKKLEFELPKLIGNFNQQNLRLRIRVVDAEGDFEEKFYGLKLNQQETPLIVSGIELSPENNVKAGKALGVRLNIKNSGIVALDGITAKVSIPELGVSTTKFVGKVENSGSELTEDFVLKILDSAQTGTYTVRTELASQFGGNKEVKELPVFVLGLSDQTTQVVNDKLIINVPVVEQDVKNDGSEVIFPITLTNQGPDANTYTLLFDGAGWANIRLTESNTFIVEPEESKTVNVFLSTDSKLAGEQLFTVMVKGNDKILNQLTLKGNVVNIQGQLFAVVLKTLLQTILIGLVVLLVALGLYLGARRYMPRKETSDFVAEDIPDQAQGEAYY
tara:strand:+ start:2075 stop:4183 length:2109 start_codon:yes stop_codon:yes gene_type:complete